MKPELSQTPAQAPAPGVYRHYKGSRYQVLGMARHSETEEWLVVYQAMYAEHGFWLRPLSLWLEPVSENSASGSTTRFQLIEENSLSLSSIIEPG